MIRGGLPWAGLAAVVGAVVAVTEARSFLASYDAAGLVGAQFGERVVGDLGPLAFGLAALVGVGGETAGFLASATRGSSLWRQVAHGLGASVVLAIAVAVIAVTSGVMLASLMLDLGPGLFIESMLNNTPQAAVGRGLGLLGAACLVVVVASAIAAQRVGTKPSTAGAVLWTVGIGAPLLVAVHVLF